MRVIGHCAFATGWPHLAARVHPLERDRQAAVLAHGIRSVEGVVRAVDVTIAGFVPGFAEASDSEHVSDFVRSHSAIRHVTLRHYCFRSEPELEAVALVDVARSAAREPRKSPPSNMNTSRPSASMSCVTTIGPGASCPGISTACVMFVPASMVPVESSVAIRLDHSRAVRSIKAR